MEKPQIDDLEVSLQQDLGIDLKSIPHWHFCDNKIDANECAQLVLSGDKQATSPSLWGIEKRDEALPQVGDLNAVTDWSGKLICIIETTNVEITPFNQITQEYAYCEGEGDKSLEYWQRVHWDYYTRELREFNISPSLEMPIVCETFRVIYSVK